MNWSKITEFEEGEIGDTKFKAKLDRNSGFTSKPDWCLKWEQSCGTGSLNLYLTITPSKVLAELLNTQLMLELVRIRENTPNHT